MQRTEYQEMFYRDVFSRIKWHYAENDLTPAEIIGMLHIIEAELTEEFMMEYLGVEIDEDDNEQPF